jgi:hypothetical protein
MKNLCIPFRIKALSELRDPAHSHSPLQYSVMVIDEVREQKHTSTSTTPSIAFTVSTLTISSFFAAISFQVFLSKLLKDKDNSKFKFLRGMPLKWVVVTDPKKLSSATDIKVLYGIDAESLSSKASMPELFDCVQVRYLFRASLHEHCCSPLHRLMYTFENTDCHAQACAAHLTGRAVFF